jgi:hypothetical protein
MSTLVNTVTIMPYLTGSYNSFFGQAFPASAKGLGFGGGLTFDLTDSGQKTGLMFDFAFQDMRGAAQNGSCVHPNPDSSTLLEAADAYHYFQYVLFEPFLKIQGGKTNGYLILGASVGYAVLTETVSRGTYHTEYTLWSGSPYGNQFRLDIRAGIGTVLSHIGTHQLVLEMRAGYPITSVISNYTNQCSGGDTGGWKIVTLQANLGLRI